MTSQVATAQSRGEQSFRTSRSALLFEGNHMRNTSSLSSLAPPPNTNSTNGTSSSASGNNGSLGGNSVLNRPRPGQGGRMSIDQAPNRDSTISSQAYASHRASGVSDSERDRASAPGASTYGVMDPRTRHALHQSTHYSSSESEESLDETTSRPRQRTLRSNSFFGIAATEDDEDDDDDGVESGAPRTSTQMRTSTSSGALREPYDEQTSSGRPSMSSSEQIHSDERRSSFYGLDERQQMNPRGSAGSSSLEPTPYSSSTNALSSAHRPAQQYYQQGVGVSADSGSGSYSSRELRSSGGTAATSTSNSGGAGPIIMSQVGAQYTAVGPRISGATYAASRTASLYNNQSGLGAAASIIEPSSSSQRLLSDQSHLQPGSMASLMSHEKTLDLYRANAKKTDDPDIQFELCTFTMEFVAEMEALQGPADRLVPSESGVLDPSTGAITTGMSPSTTSANVLTKENKDVTASTPIAMTSRQKQQELVAESVTLLNKLATRGHVKSQYFLADCYTQGIGTAKGKRDYDKAFALFMLAGKHGHSDACFRAAQCCENAWGTKKDFSKAVTLLRRAAVLNHPGAMHRLGIAELNGEIGLAKRPREGVKWLKRAAELADQVDPPQPQSLHELAVLHEKGIENVVFQDEEYAAELLARASELHYAPSAYKLGECYEYGKMGCPQDAALSIHYYNIAAQKDHPEACFALTAWYLVGSPGVLPQSDTEAYLWARKAAAMELAKAEYAVGYFTEMGIGTYKDAREAIEWFRRAATHGDKRAADRLRMNGQSIETMYGRQLSPTSPSNRAYPEAPPSKYEVPIQTKLKSRGIPNPFGGHSKHASLKVNTGGVRSVSAGQPTSANATDQRSRTLDQALDLDATLRAVHYAGRPELPRQRSVSQPATPTTASTSMATPTDPYYKKQQQRLTQVSHQSGFGHAEGPRMPAAQTSWGRSSSPSGRSEVTSPVRDSSLPGRNGRAGGPALQISTQPLQPNSRSLPPGAGHLHSGSLGYGVFDRDLPRPPISPGLASQKSNSSPNVLTKKAQLTSPTSEQTAPSKGFWHRK